MRRRFLLYILLFISAYGITQQEEDSLKKIADSGREDTITINAMNQLALLTLYNSDYLLALKYADKAKVLAAKTNFKRGLAKAYSMIGNIYYRQSNYNQALKNYLTSLRIRKELGEKLAIASTYNIIGNVHSDLGNYSESIKNQDAALKIHKEIKDKKGEANCYNNIGNIFYNQGNYPEAIKNHLFALKLREEENDMQAIAASYINIANVYTSQKNYTEALKNQLAASKIFNEGGDKQNQATAYLNVGITYKELKNFPEALKNLLAALKLSESISDKASVSLAYNNIGGVYFQQSDYPEALKNFQLALKLQEEIGAREAMSSSLVNISMVYTRANKKELAGEYASRALKLSKEIGSLGGIMEASEQLSNIYSDQHNYEKAFLYFRDYIAARDSLINEENIKKIVRMEMNFDFAKKEAVSNLEKQHLANQNQIQILEISRRNYIMLGLGLLLLIIVSLAWLLLRQNKLKAQQNAIQLEQKLLRSQMNPHFIFNALATIESFIYENQPKEAGRYLSDFARLMRLILENSSEEYITLEKEIKTLEYYLSLQKLRLENSLLYSIEVDPALDPSYIMIPPMLTQPFIENAIEHGFRGSKQTGEVKISFKENNGMLEVEVVDNGIGINKAKESEKAKTHKSMAMQITKERLTVLNRSKKQKLGFVISDVSDENNTLNGTKVRFSIPI